MPLSEVGPYRLLRLVRSGGEGDVFVAEDRRLGRRVALKIRPLPVDSMARKAALAEARLLAEFSHQLIVQIYDVVELRESLALVMEYVQGSDLEQLMALVEFEPGSVVQIALELCSALAVAHRNGVIHGDLKPANVLLTDDGHVKLSDFGIALRVDDLAPAAGSLSAVAPEQLRGDACDARVDLFALGCLLYRMLAGRHPFPGGVHSPGEAPVPFAELGISVQETLETVVFSLLAENPADRPDSALEVRRQLLAVARDFPVGDATALIHLSADLDLRRERHAEDLSAMMNQSPRRSRAPRLAWAASALLLAGGALAWLILQPGDRELAVALRAVEIVGAPATSRLRLAEMLREAVRSHPGLLLASSEHEGAALSLRVHCNEYMCSSQLQREGLAISRSDTRALLPSDPEIVWRRRIDEGIRELFPDR